jgi:uncharacterized protein YeeX (DUF496 family)
MKQLKKISKSSVPSALKMIERYRLLNEPSEAESICYDILEVDPKNTQAKVMLILSLSDQLKDRMSAFEEAHEIIDTLKKEYDRNYYMGVLCERRARAHFEHSSMSAGHVAYDWFQDALEFFDKAAKGRPKGNDKSYFRWNAVVRTLEQHPSLQPHQENTEPQLLE